MSSGVLLKYRQNTDRLHVEIQKKYRKMMVKTDNIQKKLLYIMLKCSIIQGHKAIFHFTTIIICSKKENHNREETPFCNHRTFFQVHQKKYSKFFKIAYTENLRSIKISLKKKIRVKFGEIQKIMKNSPKYRKNTQA